MSDNFLSMVQEIAGFHNLTRRRYNLRLSFNLYFQDRALRRAWTKFHCSNLMTFFQQPITVLRSLQVYTMKQVWRNGTLIRLQSRSSHHCQLLCLFNPLKIGCHLLQRLQSQKKLKKRENPSQTSPSSENVHRSYLEYNELTCQTEICSIDLLSSYQLGRQATSFLLLQSRCNILGSP